MTSNKRDSMREHGSSAFCSTSTIKLSPLPSRRCSSRKTTHLLSIHPFRHLHILQRDLESEIWNWMKLNICNNREILRVDAGLISRYKVGNKTRQGMSCYREIMPWHILVSSFGNFPSYDLSVLIKGWNIGFKINLFAMKHFKKGVPVIITVPSQTLKT